MGLLLSLKRKKYKRKVVSSILDRPISNTPVVNMHRIDKNNAGDFYCAPYHYFSQLKNTKKVDIFSPKNPNYIIRQDFIDSVSKHSIIVGGGGLLNRYSFEYQLKMMAALARKGKKIVLWSIGHNQKNFKKNKPIPSYNIDISNFKLAGTRDFSTPGEYVPCVSCLNPLFNKEYKTTTEFGIVFHKKTLKKPKIIEQFKNYSTSSNTTDIEKLIPFIGKCEKIITDSYHVMYWSMLLNKQVAVIPISSKFYDFKYKPIYTNFEQALNSFKNFNNYSGVIEECREININFADKAFDYLNI